VLPEKREKRGEGERRCGEVVREFEEMTKREQVIELFNQSFSNAGVSRLVEEAGKEKGEVEGLEARAKILESLYL
jgi:hypothetical protein